MDQLRELRRFYRNRRQSLSHSQQARHAQLLSWQLKRFFRHHRPCNIAAYQSTGGEISLNHWQHYNQRHQLYLPKLYELTTAKLRFAPLNETTVWANNRFNIPEPSVSWQQTLHPRSLDFILLPLVAFDRQGNRLGMGGGYYDRSLAFLRNRKHWKKPLLIGVAHACQEHPQLHPNDWDVPLDCIITEQETITINPPVIAKKADKRHCQFPPRTGIPTHQETN